VSVVIPALNERDNIEAVIGSIPVAELGQGGYDVEIVVVDNGSTYGTGDLARRCGALVITQPIRGYGSAYKAGFANCTGDIIATGDADLTYPFDKLPTLLELMEEKDLDFVSTDRMARLDPVAMRPSHVFGNRLLSGMSRALFLAPFHDSQSGMWVFRREVWENARVRSNGMAFSQELKHEAFARGFRCGEVAISYRPRGGEKKLRTVRDGLINASQLFTHRIRLLKPDPVERPWHLLEQPDQVVISLREIELHALKPVGAAHGS
jgi:glycosyltransferase involved in cell wall biosynthesis